MKRKKKTRKLASFYQKTTPQINPALLVGVAGTKQPTSLLQHNYPLALNRHFHQLGPMPSSYSHHKPPHDHHESIDRTIGDRTITIMILQHPKPRTRGEFGLIIYNKHLQALVLPPKAEMVGQVEGSNSRILISGTCLLLLLESLLPHVCMWTRKTSEKPTILRPSILSRISIRTDMAYQELLLTATRTSMHLFAQ